MTPAERSLLVALAMDRIAEGSEWIYRPCHGEVIAHLRELMDAIAKEHEVASPRETESTT